MAMLDIINIPAIMGRETHSFKRANVYDKLDLGLAATIGLIGSIVLMLNGFASPLVCVPASCSSSGMYNIYFRYRSILTVSFF